MGLLCNIFFLVCPLNNNKFPLETKRVFCFHALGFRVRVRSVTNQIVNSCFFPLNLGFQN